MAVQKELHPEDLHMMPAGNRTIKNSVLAKLKKSIQQYGILRSVVVVKTDLFNEGVKYYIADGQHLYVSCQALNVLAQLHIIVVKRKFASIHDLVEFISVLNTTQSPWRLADFIEAYAGTSVYLSYNKLKAKRMEYNLPYSLLAVIYSGLGKKQSSDAIKTGQFRVVNEPKSDQVAQYMLDLIPVFGRTNSTALTNLAHVFYGWIDLSCYQHSKFKKFILKNLALFNLATETEMKELIAQFDKQYV